MFIKGMRLIYSSFIHTPCTNTHIVVTSTNALAIRLEFYCCWYGQYNGGALNH